MPEKPNSPLIRDLARMVNFTARRLEIEAAYSDYRMRERLADSLGEEIVLSVEPTCIVGYGRAIPLATAISGQYKLDLVSIHQLQREEEGSHHRLRGRPLTHEDKVVIVDSTTDLNHFKTATEMLNKRNARIVGYGAVVKEIEPNLGAPLFYLTTEEDLRIALPLTRTGQ